MKTPQVKPDWNTGIYIGNGVVAVEHRRHGGAFDRGWADYYYGRKPDPHYFVDGTHTSPKITELTAMETAAYYAGYAHGEEIGDQKDYR